MYRDDDLLLADILEAASKIIEYTRGIDYSFFLNDAKTHDAVVRNFTIIGEAAKRISNEYKVQNPQIDWKGLNGFRNRIVHEYFRVDYAIVWEIIQTNILSLIETIPLLIEKNLKNRKLTKRLASTNKVFTPNSGTTVSINYSYELKILEVEYTELRIYHYTNVEAEKWEEYKEWIEKGESSGVFVNTHIKPFYDFSLVDG